MVGSKVWSLGGFRFRPVLLFWGSGFGRMWVLGIGFRFPVWGLGIFLGEKGTS